MKLWVDDERKAPEGYSHALTSNQAIKFLKYGMRYWANLVEVSLDHDLGGDDTGMKVLDWMIEHEVWPEELTIHTSNPHIQPTGTQADARRRKCRSPRLGEDQRHL